MWSQRQPLGQGCIRREGPSEVAPEAVRWAVGGGYCRLQVPLKLALAIRETVAGHGLSAPERVPPPHPLLMHLCPVGDERTKFRAQGTTFFGRQSAGPPGRS